MVAVDACSLPVVAAAAAAVAAVRFPYDAFGTLAWAAAVDAGKPEVEKRFRRFFCSWRLHVNRYNMILQY